MNFKTTIVLAVLVLAGAGIVLWRTSTRDPSQETKKNDKPSETKNVFDPRPVTAEMSRLIIEQPGKPKLAFERSGQKDPVSNLDEWWATEPQAGPAEYGNVNGIAETVAGLQSKGSFKPGAAGGLTSKEAGLDPPQAVITLMGKNPDEKDRERNPIREFKLEIGRQAVMSNDTYVRIAGHDEILLTSRDLESDLKRTTVDYRAKSPFKNARRNAAKLTIEHGGKKYDFTKKEGVDEWIMNEPARAYALSDKVRGLVNALANMQVSKFVADAPKSLSDYALDAPYLTVSLTTEEKKAVPVSQPTTDATTQPAESKFETITRSYGLIVGDFANTEKTQRFVKLADQPWVATVSKDSIESLVPKDVRDTKLARFKAADVTKIELTAGESSTTLVRTDGKWTGVGELAQVEDQAVRDLLQAVEDGRADGFEDSPAALETYGLDKPRAVLTLTTAGAVEPTTLRIGSNSKSGQNTWVQLGNQGGVVFVAADLANRLAVAPASLRSRAVFVFDPDTIQRIQTTRGDAEYALVRDEMRNWTLEKPTAPIDLASPRELTNDLALLRARKIIGPGDPAKHGLEKPAVTIEFVVQKPTQPASQPAAAPEGEAPSEPTAPAPESHRLVVGRVGKSTYAQRDDDPTIFELDESVYRALTAELINRDLFDFDAASITGIRVASNAGMVDFARDDSGWKELTDPTLTTKLSAKKLDDFAAEIAGMRAESYIQYEGADTASIGVAEPDVTVFIQAKDSEPVTLKIGQARVGDLPRKALWVEKGRAFTLRIGDADKLIRGVGFYFKPQGPETPDGEPGAQPRPPAPPRFPGNP